MSDNKAPQERSLIGGILGLMGGLLLLVAIAGVVNTAMGWNLKLEVYGSGTELPKHWDAALGLLGVAVLWMAIWSLFSYVKPLRNFSRNHPWLTALIIIGGLVGLIIGITIWDNGNRAERHAKWREERKQDSLKTIEEEKTFFEGQAVPYRLAVWNPTEKPMDLYLDTVSKGQVPPYRMMELQLPWESVKVIAKQDGKVLDEAALRPDTVTNRKAWRLEVFRPNTPDDFGSTYFMILDYSAAYKDGKLQTSFDEEAMQDKDMYITSPSANDIGGPFFVFPNEPAPAESKYRVFRIVPIPSEGLHSGPEQKEYALWLCKRIDADGGKTTESPKQQFAAYED